MPSQANIDKMWAYARKFAEKSGTSLHPDVTVTDTGMASFSLSCADSRL